MQEADVQRYNWDIKISHPNDVGDLLFIYYSSPVPFTAQIYEFSPELVDAYMNVFAAAPVLVNTYGLYTSTERHYSRYIGHYKEPSLAWIHTLLGLQIASTGLALLGPFFLSVARFWKEDPGEALHWPMAPLSYWASSMIADMVKQDFLSMNPAIDPNTSKGAYLSAQCDLVINDSKFVTDDLTGPYDPLVNILSQSALQKVQAENSSAVRSNREV